jgi:predicted membrane protein
MKRMGMSWVWGLILIFVGVGLLSNSLGVTGAHDFMASYWPIILIAIGVGEIAFGSYYGGTFWLIAGIVIGLFTTKIIHYNGNIWEVIWPVAIILFGLRFIFRPAFRMKVVHEEGSFIGSSAVFGGSSKKISSKDFKGSSVNAVFGGAKLDLRDATIAKEGAVIDVSAIFGGVEILVPRKTPIKMDAVAIFGGHEDKRDTSEIDESLPAVTIHGDVIFGGIEIKD